MVLLIMTYCISRYPTENNLCNAFLSANHTVLHKSRCLFILHWGNWAMRNVRTGCNNMLKGTHLVSLTETYGFKQLRHLRRLQKLSCCTYCKDNVDFQLASICGNFYITPYSPGTQTSYPGGIVTCRWNSFP